MNRRAFFNRIAKAAVAVSVPPGVFNCLPSTKNVRSVLCGDSLPFQDQLSNLFQQYLLTAKANAANILIDSP